MALVNPYCSVEDVRSQMSDAAGTLSAALLERAVSAASRAIDRHTSRRFWQDPEPTARTFTAADPFVLDVPDISSTDGLTVEVNRGGVWSALSADAFHLEPLDAGFDDPAYAWWTVVLDSGAGFPVSRQPRVRVTAAWGWSKVPDDVVEAAVIKSVALFKRKDSPLGVQGFQEFGPVRITRNDPDVVALLRPFVRMAVA